MNEPSMETTPEEALQAVLQQPEKDSKVRKVPGKTGRARAREFIVQALYQHLVQLTRKHQVFYQCKDQVNTFLFELEYHFH